MYLTNHSLSFLLFQQPSSGSGFVFLMPMFMTLLVYFLAHVLPQQRRRREAEAERERFLDSLRLGDHVVTVAGIYGIIVALRGKAVVVQVAPTISLTMARNSIMSRPEEVEEGFEAVFEQ